MGLAEAFRECDVIRIRDDFSNHINVGGTTNRSGSLVGDLAAPGDAANEDNLIQKRSEFANRIFQ
jgi:hypothetical protein